MESQNNYILTKLFELETTLKEFRYENEYMNQQLKEIKEENQRYKSELDKQLEITKNLENELIKQTNNTNLIIDIIAPGKFNNVHIFDIIKRFPQLKNVKWDRKPNDYKVKECMMNYCKKINNVTGDDDCNFAHSQEQFDYFNEIYFNYKKTIDNLGIKIPVKKSIYKRERKNTPNFIPIGEF